MRKNVVCHLYIEGFHRWEQAPEHLKFLSYKHRHIFVIRVKFSVQDNNREIEIIETQKKIKDFIKRRFGVNDEVCDFGNMACEDIAELIINEFNAESAEVLEDGFGGAELVRQ